ncbi:MAG: hypothetical protein RLZZ265_2959 [Verrucomicrobiota bacterium]
MLSCLGGALLFRSPTTCQRVRPVVFTNTTWLAGHIQRLHILQASHWFAPLGNGLWSGLGRDEEFNAVLSATERAANHSVLRSCTATRCHPFLPFPVGCTHGYGCFSPPGCKRCSRGPMVPWSAASSRRLLHRYAVPFPSAVPRGFHPRLRLFQPSGLQAVPAKTGEAMECGEFSPLSAGDLSPSAHCGVRIGRCICARASGNAVELPLSLQHSTATSRLRKAVTSHRTP